MSKTYLDRKNPEGSYVFISYSHKDGEEVGRILTALNGCGADFWYDIKLRGGQDWIERVKQITSNKKCVGILYFISANSIMSDACFEEFKMLDELKKSHGKFDAMYVLLSDEEVGSLDDFFDNADEILKNGGIDRKSRVNRISDIQDNFDQNKIYRSVTRKKIDDDSFVDGIFNDVFKAWGCASEETGKIDVLKEDELVDADYRVKTRCRISVDLVRGSDAEWKVFSYNGDTISAILVSDELYAATCLSLARGAMDAVNDSVNISLNPDATDESKSEKHFRFDEEFLECIKKDGDGKIIRYLRAAEHEKNYLQLKEALEKVPVPDSVDDGYFFVQDNQGSLLFADRGSSDVYRHIHVDAYASLIPVIDLDYQKYASYVLRRSKN